MASSSPHVAECRDGREMSGYRSPPAKSRKVSLLHGMRRRLAKPFTADRHSCLAAPYSCSDPRTARFFDLVISKADAPVVCASAGKIKGKAIYADRDLPKNTNIWTEAPYLAMQHEHNNRTVPCCQYCFVPLIGDYKEQWTEMAAQWNARQSKLRQQNERQHQHDPKTVLATPNDLDDAVEKLCVERHHCGLAGAAVRCACGETYCSKMCQTRAYHEFHAILCPRDDSFSAMSVFIRHTQETNDIFLLVAKVIARVLSRFLVTQDLIKAREAMDMFHKKPWWEVVMIEKHVQQHNHDGGGSTGLTSTSSSSSTTSSTSGNKRVREPTRASEYNHDHDAYLDQYQATIGGAAVNELGRGDARRLYGDGDAAATSSASSSPGESSFLKDLLVSTHQLLLDAMESNLVHLEREDQLRGHTVDELWTSCASILSFEFFAAQLGLFEMNNIRVEIDHPFHALMEVLDHSDEDAALLQDDEKELFTRVLDVLSFGEQQRMRAQLDALLRDGMAPDGDPEEILQSGALQGFPSIDGTALFSIICTMNHSCDPNCTVLYTKNGDAHVVAVRDIKKGEELCICYIDIDQDVRTREAMLKEYQFRCLCSRCTIERRQFRAHSGNGTSVDVGMTAFDDHSARVPGFTEAPGSHGHANGVANGVRVPPAATATPVVPPAAGV